MTEDTEGFAPRNFSEPRPGWFKLRSVPRGPFMPARIYRPIPIEPGTNHVLDRWPRLVAEIDGAVIEDIYEIWDWGREITEADFDFITTVTWPEHRDEYYADR